MHASISQGTATLPWSGTGPADPGAWVDVTSYTNMEGEDAGEPALTVGGDGITVNSAGTYFVWLANVNWSNTSGSSEASASIEVEITINGGGGTALTLTSSVPTLFGSAGYVGGGGVVLGLALSPGDVLSVRARVTYSDVDITLDRVDFGVRFKAP